MSKIGIIGHVSTTGLAAAVAKTVLQDEHVKFSKEPGKVIVSYSEEPSQRYVQTAGEEAPPRRLSNEATHKDFRPDFLRVGVRIDGVERKDISFYDADMNVFKTLHSGLRDAVSIEPYWRYAATRQQRRALERWRNKRKST